MVLVVLVVCLGSVTVRVSVSRTPRLSLVSMKVSMSRSRSMSGTVYLLLLLSMSSAPSSTRPVKVGSMLVTLGNSVVMSARETAPFAWMNTRRSCTVGVLVMVMVSVMVGCSLLGLRWVGVVPIDRGEYPMAVSCCLANSDVFLVPGASRVRAMP